MTDRRRTTVEWTDEQLDAALADLRSDVQVNPDAPPAARARLLAAVAALPSDEDHHESVALASADTHRAVAAVPTADAPGGSTALRARRAASRRRVPGRRGLLAAAAVVILVGAGLIAPTFWTRDDKPVVSADAARSLTQAAAAIGASDQPVGPGQYRYLDTHAWSSVTSRYDVYLVENRITEWVPADPGDPNQLWMLDRAPTGEIQWITGDREAFDANADGRPALSPTLQTTAVCGDFFGDAGGCGRAGAWADPTPEFLAGLPRDPGLLYDRLRADAPDNGRGDAELLTYAADLLRTGLAPADLRAALYRTLATLPGLEITDAVANLDGRTGTAFGIEDGDQRQDLIIDPATGTYIGERQVLTEDRDGAPAGTTVNFTSLTTDVVDALGARPGQ